RVALRKLSSAPVLANVQRQSAALRAGLKAINGELDLFAEVRGRGLLLGAVLRDAYKGKASAILDVVNAHGVLLLQAGPDVLRFAPPLTISDDEMRDGLHRLGEALRRFAAA
ncbi:MAG: aminotransferase class III-fold pyridoxal phosphate-dependent enzyme, partial [Burkholderiaceae bacterium]|nr:aminotransferase class III-fold pyridoxal phosphate-dependent enzyme [Burkholderiaceae bacterium]